MIHQLEFYSPDELKVIILQSAKKLGVEIDEEGALELARRSRGTPRLANRLLKRVRDFAQVRFDGVITKEVAVHGTGSAGGGCHGAGSSTTGPCCLPSLRNLPAVRWGWTLWQRPSGRMPGTIEEVYEPYLVKSGLIQRTPKGRVATELAYRHFGI